MKVPKLVCMAMLALSVSSLYAGDYDSLFEQITEIVDENFYDSTFNGIDWENVKSKYGKKVGTVNSRASFSTLVDQMLSKLNASHTHYYTQDDPVYYHLADIFKDAPPFKPAICKAFNDCTVKFTGIGIIITKFGEKVFVKAVLDSTPAHRAGILAGDRILSVDGQPYEPIASFKGRAGSEVKIEIQREDKGKAQCFTVMPQEFVPSKMFGDALRNSAQIVSRHGIDVAYVHIWSFAGENYYESLRELVATKLADAQALVVDLRYGPGGANPWYLNIFNSRVPVIKHRLRNGRSWIYDPQWRKPVVLLVNEDTRSGKEIFAYGFKKYNYGKIVGTRTAGAGLAARPYFLSDGSMLYLAGGAPLIDADTIEGKGVTPDVVVTQKVKYRAGEDTQLEKAFDTAAKEVK